MDEGSSEIVVHDNTIFGTARSPIRFHKCQMNTISSNRLYVAEGVGPFTYNNTDRALVHLRQNEILSGSPGSDVVLPE